MKKFGSVDEVLDYAIAEEQKAHDFYMELSGKVEKPWMKKALVDFAKEESGHKQKLLGVKQGKQLLPSAAQVLDLGRLDRRHERAGLAFRVVPDRPQACRGSPKDIHLVRVAHHHNLAGKAVQFLQDPFKEGRLWLACAQPARQEDI